jgi:WD40 repeat protein
MTGRLSLGWVAFVASLTFVGVGRSDGPWLGMLSGHEGAVCCMAFSPDGKTLAVGSGLETRANTFGEVKLWEVATGQPRGTLRGDGKRVRALAFAPDGRALAAADEAGTVRVWDLERARERLALKGHGSGAGGVAFTPDGKLLAGGSGGTGSVKLWDAVTGEERGRLPAGSGIPVAFVAGGKRLVTFAHSTLQLWDVSPQKRRLTLATGSDDWVAVSPDGGLLAAGSQSERASLWEAATGKLRFTFPPAGTGDS